MNLFIRPALRSRFEALPAGLGESTTVTVAEQLEHLQEPATRWRYEAVVGDDDLADWLLPSTPPR